MVSEYTLNDEVSTLRIWFDTKPFSKELQEDIKKTQCRFNFGRSKGNIFQ